MYYHLPGSNADIFNITNKIILTGTVCIIYTKGRLCKSYVFSPDPDFVLIWVWGHEQSAFFFL